MWVKERMVPLEGLEPPLLSERDFESRASTGSATGAPVASGGSIAERRRHARRAGRREGSDARMDADESTEASVPVFIYRFHTM